MYEYRAKVTRCVDGDTVDVNINVGFDILYSSRIRLLTAVLIFYISVVFVYMVLILLNHVQEIRLKKNLVYWLKSI